VDVPDNALIYVDNIRDALVKYDPTNAQTYQRNAEIYKQKITATLDPCVNRWQRSRQTSAGW
jgi:manganese/iron transport system substrate-binding protein